MHSGKERYKNSRESDTVQLFIFLKFKFIANAFYGENAI
jgi:hypothetical protein